MMRLREACSILALTTCKLDALSAGHAHVARHGGTVVRAVDDEVVTLGLARDRLGNRGMKEIVGFRGAKRGTQVGGVLLPEAHEQRARAGHADAVAAFAEIMG